MNHAFIPGRRHVVQLHRRPDAFSDSTQIFKGKVSFYTDVILEHKTLPLMGMKPIHPNEKIQ